MEGVPLLCACRASHTVLGMCPGVGLYISDLLLRPLPPFAQDPGLSADTMQASYVCPTALP